MNWTGLLVFMFGVPLVFSAAYLLLLGIGRLWGRWLHRRRKPMPPSPLWIRPGDYGPPLNVYERYRMGQAEWAWEQDTVPHPVEQP